MKFETNIIESPDNVLPPDPLENILFVFHIILLTISIILVFFLIKSYRKNKQINKKMLFCIIGLVIWAILGLFGIIKYRILRSILAEIEYVFN